MSQRPSHKLRAMAACMIACALTLIALLAFAALMGSGVAERSVTRETLVLLGTGVAVLAFLLVAMQALAVRCSDDALPPAPELATMNFHPAPHIGRRGHLQRIK